MEISFEKLPHAVSLLSDRLANIEKLLSEKLIGSISDSDDVITIEQAAAYLRVKKKTVYQYVHDKTIPHFKKGKRLFFSKKELTEWIKAGKKKTHEELKVSAHESIKIKKK